LLGLSLPLAAEPGVVLLKNGEVFHGQIEAQGEEVRIFLPNGEVRFRTADVECAAATIKELFLKKQAAVLPGDAQEHLRVAQWCIRQGLFDEAAIEINTARTIDPHNPAVPLMARRLELCRIPTQSPQPRGTAVATRPSNGLDDLDRLVHAMPEKAVESYTQRVQPMIMNTCATATCHGPQSATKLQLMRVAGGHSAGRRLTQRNLQALQPWIDSRDPAASPLLKYATSIHASGKAQPLSPESAQYRRMLEWVHQVARAEDRLPPTMPVAKHLASPERASGAGQGVVLASGTEPVESGKVHRHGVVRAGGAPPESMTQQPPPQQPGDAPAAKPEAQPAASRDPFDPEIFNRRFLPK
jgi:hypothetical protein